MKSHLFIAILVGIAKLSHAFIVPLSFDQKCRDSDAVLVITVEKVERTTLTEGMPWQFKSLARCRVLSTFKGDKDWSGKYIFIPCDYEFDESPCDIKVGKSYVVFLETMGNFSKFGHPLSADCYHEVIGGKAHTGIEGSKPVDLEVFGEKVFTASLKASASNPGEPKFEQEGK